MQQQAYETSLAVAVTATQFEYQQQSQMREQRIIDLERQTFEQGIQAEYLQLMAQTAQISDHMQYTQQVPNFSNCKSL